MTSGKPLGLILAFALPLLGGMLFQQFYSLVDTLIVGRFLGMEALAGVGSTNAISFMIIGFCMGVCNGFAIPISQKFGAGSYSVMRRYFSHSILLAALFSLVMTVVVCLLTGTILTAMNTPEDIYSYAYDYIFIIFLGIPVVYAYNLLSAAIRALGDSVAPVVFLIAASLLNIFLDLLFILSFHLGVAGAAGATVLSQAVSAVLSASYILFRVPELRIRRDEWKIDLRSFGVLLLMGVPMGLQYSITAIGSVILQTAINGLGSICVAAVSAGSKVLSFFECPYDALGSTMATYSGQNVGADKPERLNPGLLASCFLGIVYAFLAVLTLFFFGRHLTGLFLESGTESLNQVIEYGWLYLVINSAFFIPLTFVNCVRFTIQGMGHSGIAIFAGVMEMIGRITAVVLLIPLFGFAGGCFASPIAWIFADIFLFLAYFHERAREYRRLGRHLH